MFDEEIMEYAVLVFDTAPDEDGEWFKLWSLRCHCGLDHSMLEYYDVLGKLVNEGVLEVRRVGYNNVGMDINAYRLKH